MIKRSNTLEFIDKANEIHNNKYDYSLVKYINNKTKVKIICSKHGEFEQLPANHLTGRGCRSCSNDSFRISDIVNKFIEIHTDKYDYSLVSYINNREKVKIICKTHGIFEQSPCKHLTGQGCPNCSIQTYRYSWLEIKDKFIDTHGMKYDYSLVKYVSNKVKVDIACKKHGIFKQTPKMHIKGQGCPSCKKSVGEIYIENILKLNNINYIAQKKFDTCVYKRRLCFDFYLPKYNILIEYDGKQHDDPNHYFNIKSGSFLINKIKDNIKDEWSINNKIKLIRIKSKEDIDIIIFDIIKKPND